MIAAAGSGQRLGAGGPKAFVPLGGRRMVEWSIAAFRAAPSVRSIVVACPPGHVHDLAGGDVGVVDGGATRAQSVSNALEAVGTELVAIHDAARPLVTPELIEGVIATLTADPEAAAAIAATPVTDTIKQAPLGATLYRSTRTEKRCTSWSGPWSAAVSGRRRLRRSSVWPRCARRWPLIPSELPLPRTRRCSSSRPAARS